MCDPIALRWTNFKNRERKLVKSRHNLKSFDEFKGCSTSVESLLEAIMLGLPLKSPDSCSIEMNKIKTN